MDGETHANRSLLTDILWTEIVLHICYVLFCLIEHEMCDVVLVNIYLCTSTHTDIIRGWKLGESKIQIDDTSIKVGFVMCDTCVHVMPNTLEIRGLIIVILFHRKTHNTYVTHKHAYCSVDWQRSIKLSLL